MSGSYRTKNGYRPMPGVIDWYQAGFDREAEPEREGSMDALWEHTEMCRRENERWEATWEAERERCRRRWTAEGQQEERRRQLNEDPRKRWQFTVAFSGHGAVVLDGAHALLYMLSDPNDTEGRHMRLAVGEQFTAVHRLTRAVIRVTRKPNIRVTRKPNVCE